MITVVCIISIIFSHDNLVAYISANAYKGNTMSPVKRAPELNYSSPKVSSRKMSSLSTPRSGTSTVTTKSTSTCDTTMKSLKGTVQQLHMNSSDSEDSFEPLPVENIPWFDMNDLREYLVNLHPDKKSNIMASGPTMLLTYALRDYEAKTLKNLLSYFKAMYRNIKLGGIEDHETKTKPQLIKEILSAIGKIKVYESEKEYVFLFIIALLLHKMQHSLLTTAFYLFLNRKWNILKLDYRGVGAGIKNEPGVCKNDNIGQSNIDPLVLESSSEDSEEEEINEITQASAGFPSKNLRPVVNPYLKPIPIKATPDTINETLMNIGGTKQQHEDYEDDEEEYYYSDDEKIENAKLNSKDMDLAGGDIGDSLDALFGESNDKWVGSDGRDMDSGDNDGSNFKEMPIKSSSKREKKTAGRKKETNSTGIVSNAGEYGQMNLNHGISGLAEANEVYENEQSDEEHDGLADPYADNENPHGEEINANNGNNVANNIEAFALACSNVDIQIEENIDVKMLTQEYNRCAEAISALVSLPIMHRSKNVQFVYTFLEKPKTKSSLFFLKPNLMQAVTTRFHQAFRLAGINYTAGQYIADMKYLGIRRSSYDESSKYKRAGRNNSIVQVFAYVTEYPGDMAYTDIMDDQKKIGEVIWKDVWGNHNRIKNIGKNVLKEAESMGGGLHRWLMQNKGGADAQHPGCPEMAASNICNDIVHFFEDGISWRFKVALDHLMVDYDIREFLITKIGCTSWDDLDEREKAKCFKNYPTKALPSWDSLVRESF